MPWLLSRKRARTAQKAQSEPDGQEDAPLTTRELVGQLLVAVTELRERVNAQDADITSLRMEWAETLDKIHRWSARQSARLRRDTEANLDAAMASDSHQASRREGEPMTKDELRRKVFGGAG